MSENLDLQLIEPRQLAARVSPMDALAMMSDDDFRRRLEALKTAQKRMEIIQRELMTPDVDYGVIPGTGSKPTLLKSGAEKLCKFHRLVPTFSQQTILGDGITGPHIRVLSICSLHAEAEDGPIIGQGLGACNSWEKKYRYRDSQRQCPMCGQPTIFKSKKEEGGWFCWAKKGGCGAQFKDGDKNITDQVQGQVDNPDPFDGENTLEKMSAKRAYVDATLRATATSGLFSQDLEDIAAEEQISKPAPKQPTPLPRDKPPQRPAPAKIVDDQPHWDEEPPTQPVPVAKPKLPDAKEPVFGPNCYTHNPLCPKDCDARVWQAFCAILSEAQAANMPIYEFEPMDTAAVRWVGGNIKTRLEVLHNSQEFDRQREATV